MPFGLTRLVPIRRQSGLNPAVADTTGKVYSVSGLKVGSTAIIYGNGTQIATATVDGTGKATWTLGSAPAAGTIITYDGVVVGSGGTVPSLPPVPGAIRQLSTVSAAPLAAYGLTRMVSGYAGAAMPVSATAASAPADVGFNSDNSLNLAAADAVGTLVKARGWYDQTGRGNHALASNTSPSDFPTLTTLRRGFGAAYPDAPIAMCNGEPGYQGDGSYYTDTSRGFTIPAGVTFDRANFTMLAVMDAQLSLQTEGLFGAGDAAGTNRVPVLTQPGNPGLSVHKYTAAGGATPALVTAPPPICVAHTMQVIAIVSRNDAFEIHVNDQVYSASPQEALALAGGLLGMSPTTAYRTRANVKACVLYGLGLPAGDVNTLKADFYAMHNIEVLPKTVVIYTGSSSQEGQGGRLNYTPIRVAIGKMTKAQPKVYNMGISGRALTQINSGFAAEIAPLIQYWKSKGVRVVVWQGGGSNDLSQGGNAASLKASGQTFVTNCRNAGADLTISETLFPRGDFSAANNTDKDSYNSTIGSAGIYDVIVDTGRISTLQDFTNSTYYVADQIHRKNPAVDIVAATMAPTLDTYAANEVYPVPGQVTGLTLGTATSSAQPLSWNAPSSGGPVAAYRVEFKKSTDTAWTLFSRPTGTTETVTGLPGSTSHDYRVIATNSGGPGTPSTVATGSTAAGAVVPAPAVGDVILVHFYDSRSPSNPTAATGWNKYNQASNGPSNKLAVKNSAGGDTGLTVYLGNTGTMTAGNNTGAVPSPAGSGDFPDDVILASVFADVGGGAGFGTSTQVDAKFEGLAAGTQWKVEMLASRAVADRKQSFNVNSLTAITGVQVGQNKLISATYTGVAPVSGAIDCYAIPFTNSSNYAYLNGVRLTRTA